MSEATFRQQIAALTAQLAGRALDDSLDAWLNREHGAGSATFDALRASCREGVAEGWLCNREGGGIKYGPIFKPAPTAIKPRGSAAALMHESVNDTSSGNCRPSRLASRPATVTSSSTDRTRLRGRS